MAHHELYASAKTVHWGFYDSSLPPVLRIRSGDTLTLGTVSGHPGDLPPESHLVPPELLEIHRHVAKGEGPHILTGPIYVEGAEAGDALEIRIEEIEPRFEWAYNRILPLHGALPEEFPRLSRVTLRVDRAAMTAEWLPGIKIPLRPFFGNIGVAPPRNYGRVSSVLPLEHGGNMDNKELGPGSTLYLPVWNRGALLSIGDGHGAQGDGEVDLTAVEMGLLGRLQITVRKDLTLKVPRAETSTHYITMGYDTDLDDAAKMALREMIGFMNETFGLGREDAYRLCSMVVDLRITQVVNQNKGVHALLPKGILGDPKKG